MLYLAEVIQRKGGIMGGGKAELKLLACQRNEQSWTAVNAEEVIPADEAARYSAGALLLVDLTNSKQVQRIQEAGRPLVSILQNFSRLQEKFKTQEEEIEQWKQSLTYQSQELNRREMEMEARREQLEQLEDDFEQLEQQRQALESTRGEIDGLRGELERRQQELEGAWDHLRGEQQRLDEKVAEAKGGAVLDEQKAAQLQGILSHFSGSAQPLELCQGQITYAHELVTYKQEVLAQHWQALEQQRSSLDQQRHDLEQRSQELQQQESQWQAAQGALEQTKALLQAQQTILQGKQDQLTMLHSQMQWCEEMHQSIQATNQGVDANVAAQVDVAALEAMPIYELEQKVNELQSELQKSSVFVKGQEEELDLKQKEISDIEAKIAQASEFDRMTLESELSDEKDAYQFLHETLVGQQRNIREKEGVLKQHKFVLARLQGKPEMALEEGEVDLSALSNQVNSLQTTTQQRIANLEADVKQMQDEVGEKQSLIDQEAQQLNARRQGLDEQVADLHNLRLALGEAQGQVKLYEGMLQPLQDSVDNLRKTIDEVSNQMGQLRSTGEAQQSAVGQMNEMLNGLMPQPV